ncbi:MAG: polysaccharide deacetylase family protein [Planctomycetota bacterium]|nr:MAG: polysaccharide deacetylase family protein [Planctomycetota bacterium]REK23727.1 MAG: polysaccharide deacetylase family protein [Planctomycetota bacterium]REK47580.1 MAG: polysaccharide deacetylase family protein [Planctomycetota bacterium]
MAEMPTSRWSVWFIGCAGLNRNRTMPNWKRWILSLYYHGTLPLRMVRRAQAVAAGRAPILIFTWHRIADDAANAWTTSNDTFARAIGWLERRFDLVSLAEAQERIRGESLKRPAACVTFDDGYAENCQQALPLLIRRRIPVTYFVTAGSVLTGEAFAHDRQLGQSFAPNTLKQLRELAAFGVEIGAHTRSHPNLGQVRDEATLYDEVVTARDDLSAALEQPIRYFAFPFGQHEHLNRRAFEMARDAGYEGAVSAYGGYHYPGESDAFHLQRMCADGPLVKLKNWASFDPWKDWKIQSYSLADRTEVPATAGAASL